MYGLEDFPKVTSSMVRTLLVRDTLAADEGDIYHGVYTWAFQRMLQQKPPVVPSPQNVRPLMEDLLPLIRFTTMYVYHIHTIAPQLRF